jgi:hypothetical protein
VKQDTREKPKPANSRERKQRGGLLRGQPLAGRANQVVGRKVVSQGGEVARLQAKVELLRQNLLGEKEKQSKRDDKEVKRSQSRSHTHAN